MVQGDELAYALFKVHKHVNLSVVALQKNPCILTRYAPGVYALVEFCNTLDGVTIPIQVV